MPKVHIRLLKQEVFGVHSYARAKMQIVMGQENSLPVQIIGYNHSLFVDGRWVQMKGVKH
ncbi:hypothetical protein LFE_0918 [Leptospirillum ferrooxidans C2-3]|uniref:Uncharacterized protein n=1 Tax=Leptospirillum ferrooxidans (strain C2-3) TaxID=1162668 RepID=I0IMX3_LEPFC|nr:hypothetical protein LFE_0918 [Leptospirillum ferrooxidans C2-3]